MPSHDIWQRLARRHARNPGRIPLDSLPVELLHQVCQFLNLKELKTFRLSCRLFATIGSDYLLDELHVYYKRDDFERLVEIARHPASAKATSIIFFGDRLETLTKSKWMHERESYLAIEAERNRGHRAYHVLSINDDGEATELPINYNKVPTERSNRAARRIYHKDQAEGKKAGPEEIDLAYSRYRYYVEDQCKIGAENLDYKSLVECFGHRPLINQLRCVLKTTSVRGPGGKSLPSEMLI